MRTNLFGETAQDLVNNLRMQPRSEIERIFLREVVIQRINKYRMTMKADSSPQNIKIFRNYIGLLVEPSKLIDDKYLYF